MTYRECAAPVVLEPWLDCLWEQTGDGRPVRVLPDGCVDIVWRSGLGALLVGANTTAFLVPLADGEHAIGARLRPGAAPGLLAVTGEHVRNAQIPIADSQLRDGARLGEELDASAQPLGTLSHWLSHRAPMAAPSDPVVAAAVTRLRRSADDVAGLARELGTSERNLRRRMTAAVGYGPKRLGRVLRLQRALADLRAGHEVGRVAFAHGYSDQAHFCGDCRELTGLAPSLLAAA